MYKVYKNVEMTKEGYLFGIENKEAVMITEYQLF